MPHYRYTLYGRWWVAQENTDLTDKKWGGRSGKPAVDPAMRKMLAFEYGRLIYVNIALFTNNAVACFDRIVPSISTLVAHKYSVAPSILQARNLVKKTWNTTSRYVTVYLNPLTNKNQQTSNLLKKRRRRPTQHASGASNHRRCWQPRKLCTNIFLSQAPQRNAT